MAEFVSQHSGKLRNIKPGNQRHAERQHKITRKKAATPGKSIHVHCQMNFLWNRRANLFADFFHNVKQKRLVGGRKFIWRQFLLRSSEKWREQGNQRHHPDEKRRGIQQKRHFYRPDLLKHREMLRAMPVHPIRNSADERNMQQRQQQHRCRNKQQTERINHRDFGAWKFFVECSENRLANLFIRRCVLFLFGFLC